MSDPTNLAGGEDVSADLDTDTIEGVETDALNQDDNAGDEGLDGDGQLPDDDGEDVEYEGANYRVPKAIKGALMRQADYTQKTQSLAADRQTLDGHRQAFAQHVQLSQALAQERGKLAVLDHQISQYSPEALRQIATEAPDQLPLVQLELQQLERDRAALAGEISQKEGQALETQRHAVAQQTQQCLAVLQRDIPGGWNDNVAKEVTTFGQAQFGFTPQELGQVVDPRMIKVLHLAMVGAKLHKAQQATRKVQQQQQTRPAHAIQSRGAGGRIAARPDTDDFAAFERAHQSR